MPAHGGPQYQRQTSWHHQQKQLPQSVNCHGQSLPGCAFEHDIAPGPHCKLPASQGGLMKRISKGWKRGSSSHGTGSTISSSGADSRGSARSGAMGSIAFTGSSGSRGKNKNLLMETNMAFEHGSDGGRTKRSHGTGFFAFSQVPTSFLSPLSSFTFCLLPFAFPVLPSHRLPLPLLSSTCI